MTRIQANLVLLIAAAIWGGGFVAQSTAMSAIGPYWFVCLRFAIATLTVAPFLLLESRASKRRSTTRHIGLSALTGLALFGGAITQQIGLETTTVTNSAFITGLYVIFVPLIATVLLKRQPHWIVWPAALLAVLGIFLLSGGTLSAFSRGDGLTLVCSLFWAGQITLAGIAVSETERPLLVSTIQFAVTALCAFVVAVVFEPVHLDAVLAAGPEILYVGIFSSGLAFFLQLVGQRYTTASQAAIFLSSEALFGAALGALILGEVIAPIGYVGCALMFAAMLMVELVPELNRKWKTART